MTHYNNDARVQSKHLAVEHKVKILLKRRIVFCWKVVFELRMFNDVTVLTVHLSFSLTFIIPCGWGAGKGRWDSLGKPEGEVLHTDPTLPFYREKTRLFFFFFCTLDGFNTGCSQRDSVHFVDCLRRRTLLFPTWGRSTSRWGMVIRYDKGFLYRWAPGTLESTDRIGGREPRQADPCSYRIQIHRDETLLTVVLRRLLGAALYISVYMAKGVTLTAGGGSHMWRACCGWYVLYAEGRLAALAMLKWSH